jgi:cyclase
MMVDEVVLLDARSSALGDGPNLKLIDKIRCQSFFPLSYGGGIRTLKQASDVLSLGIEKVVINTLLLENPSVVKAMVAEFGAQSVVLSLDIKHNLFGKPKLYGHLQRKNQKPDPIQFLKSLLADFEPGEILLTSVDKEGKNSGYDLDMLKSFTEEFPAIPIVVNGGARDLRDMREAIKIGAHAAAATSLFVYKNGGILINYPGQKELKQVFENE